VGERGGRWQTPCRTALAAVLLTACTGQPPTRPPASHAAAPTRPPTTRATPHREELTCSSPGPFGSARPTERERRTSVVAGPLAFAGLKLWATRPARDFQVYRGGRVKAHKLGVEVDPGATATVTVPPAERGHLALAYGELPDAVPTTSPDGFTLLRIADANHQVTFRACRPEPPPFDRDPTVFPGYLLVAGARCAALAVSSPGRPRPRRVTVSFGAGRCRDPG
jgi:hypothetical protein